MTQTAPTLIATVLLLTAVPTPGRAQVCEGDFDGNGRVTIDEVITTVVNGLEGCPAAAPTPSRTATAPPESTPTPTQTNAPPTPTSSPSPTATLTPARAACGGSFFQNNSANPGLPVCGFVGRWNPGCGSNQLVVGWASDGFNIVIEIVEPRIFFGAQAIDRDDARLTGWWTQPNATDFKPTAGAAFMTSDTAFFSISPTGGAPFSIGGCPFEGFTGRYFTDLQGIGSGTSADMSLSADVALDLEQALQTFRDLVLPDPTGLVDFPG